MWEVGVVCVAVGAYEVVDAGRIPAVADTAELGFLTATPGPLGRAGMGALAGVDAGKQEGSEAREGEVVPLMILGSKGGGARAPTAGRDAIVE